MRTSSDDPVRQPKEPVSTIAGPYGHPIHPMLIPIPIGAWVISFVFDVLSRAADNPQIFAVGSRWLIGIGIASALLAAVFGMMDLITIPRGTPAFKTGITHMTLNLLVVGLFAVSFFIRLGTADTRPVPITLMILSAVALTALAVSGWLGGRMTYRYGVRVAAEDDQADGYRRVA